MSKKNLGKKAKCLLTGFEGTICAYMETITGERKYDIQANEGEVKGYIFDLEQIKVKKLRKGLTVKIPKEPKFSLGNRVKCRETEIEGIINRIEYYMNGCTAYRIAHPPLKKTGKIYTFVFEPSAIWVDNGFATIEKIENTGGPIELSTHIMER